MHRILLALLVAVGVVIAAVLVLSQISVVGLDLRQYTPADKSLDRFFEPTLARVTLRSDQHEALDLEAANEELDQREALEQDQASETADQRAPLSCSIEIEVVDDTAGEPVAEFVAITQLVHPGVEQPPEFDSPQRDYEGADGKLTIESLYFTKGSNVEVRIYARGMMYEGDPGPMTAGPNLSLNISRDDLERRIQSFVPAPGARHHLCFRVILDAPEREVGACVCSGIVVDARDGTPIQGANILSGPPPLRSFQSDVHGRFRFARSCDGDSSWVWIKHAKYERLSAWPACDGELRMQPRGSMSGIVLDGTGHPLSGARVSLDTDEPGVFGLQRDGPTITDKNGRFRISDLQAAEYCVSVDPPPRHGGDGSRLLYDAAFFVQQELPYLFTRACVKVASGQDTEVRLERRPPETVELRGVVRASERLAAPMMPLFFGESRESGWIESTISPDGEYWTGAMKRGRYLVLLLTANDDLHDVPCAVAPLLHVDGFAEQFVDFDLPVDSVRGTVQGVGPSESIRVIARPPETLAGPAEEMLDSERFTSVFGAELDARGGFVLSHIFTGRHRLELRDGARVVASRDVDVAGAIDIGVWDVLQ